MAAGERAGQVVRGVAHVDLDLAQELATRPFARVDYARYTGRSLAATAERDHTYEAWAVGQPYANEPFSVTQIPEPRQIGYRTMRVVRRSLRGMAWRLGGNVAATAAVVGASAAGVAPWIQFGVAPAGVLALALPVGAAGLGALVLNTRGMLRLFKAAFVELPVDAVLLDMGQALFDALRDAELIDRNLPAGALRLEQPPGGSLQIYLDGASAADSSCFALAFQEMLGPLGDARSSDRAR